MEKTELVGERCAGQTCSSASKKKGLIRKMVLLTILSIGLGMAQGWAAARTYRPDHEAGFDAGLLHGILMPAALPGLVLGQPLPIYATNNSGNPYNIGFILGINACGTVFFGIAFWQRRAVRSDGKWHPPSPRLRRTGMADGKNE
jgi:hypothetical protein